MKINVPIVVMAVLLANSGLAVSNIISNFFLKQLCSKSTLVTVKSGLPFAKNVYVDGTLIPNGPSKTFSIARGSGVAGLQLSPGAGRIAAAAAKIFPAASKWVCTNTSMGTDNSWTRLAFDDSRWPFQVSLETVWSWTKGIINNLAWATKNVNTDIYCRAYLRCYTPPTTTPVPVTSTTATTRPSSTSTTTSTTTTTPQPTTTTTTPATTSTTTTTAAPSLIPVLITSVGGGIFGGGDPTSLQCLFTVTPVPSVVNWFLKGVQLNSPQSTLTQQSDGTWLATLSISAVGIDTVGQYSCVASNAVGSSQAAFFDVSVDYTEVTTLPTNYPLTGVNPQTILLQASEGCTSLHLTILDADLAQVTAIATYTDMYFFAGDNVYINNVQAPYPDQCNSPYVWIWIQIAADNSVTVGVGPTPGQNSVLSSPPFTDYPGRYLRLDTFDGTPQKFYVYPQ